MSASWLRVSTYLTWILGSRLSLSNNQSRATLCSRSVSHRWTFAFDDNLDSCFVVLKNGQQCIAVRKLYVRVDVINLLPILLFRRGEAFFCFVRVLGCFSHYKRIAPGFPLPTGAGDECNTSIANSHGSRASPSSFPCMCCLDMAEHSSVRKLKWLRERRSWVHSSRVEVPLVKMSASWLRLATYVTQIIRSRLILSNNQSSASLWVQDTCLIVRLLLLMIILITASLLFKNAG